MRKIFVTCLMVLILILSGCPKHPSMTHNEPKPQDIKSVVVQTPQPSSLDVFSVSPAEEIMEYNVILLSEADIDSGICGGTVIYSGPVGSLVLTAAHCVLDRDESVVPYLFIEPGDGDFYKVKVIDFNRADDLAILATTDRTPILMVAPLSPVPPTVGETVWVTGFGAGIKDVMSKGIVAKTKGDWKEKAFLVDCTSWYGNSGGGVFNEYGELMGVVSRFGPQFRGHGPETGWMWAVSWEAIMNLLQRRI